MPPFSYKKAKAAGVISEKDLERCAMLYLTMADDTKPTTKQYELAAAEAGNTKASFQTLFSSFLKKMRDKDCYAETGETADGDATAPSAGATPKTPKARGRPKRKGVEEGEESPKKKSPKKKGSDVMQDVIYVKKPNSDADDEDDDNKATGAASD